MGHARARNRSTHRSQRIRFSGHAARLEGGTHAAHRNGSARGAAQRAVNSFKSLVELMIDKDALPWTTANEHRVSCFIRVLDIHLACWHGIFSAASWAD